MKRALILFMTCLCLGLPAAALAADDIRFESLAQVEVEKVNAKGEKVLERQPAKLVTPGTIVIYTNDFTNAGKKPAERLVVSNPVPKDMEYLSGSATGKGMTITFSIDGGKTFDAPDKLFVVGRDGKRRPADPKEYTHIRWILGQPLPPGGKGSVEFRARLK